MLPVVVLLWLLAASAKADDSGRERILDGAGAAVLDLAFAPAGGTVAAATAKGTIVFWEVDSGRRTGVSGGGPGASGYAVVKRIAYSPTGESFASIISSSRWQQRLTGRHASKLSYSHFLVTKNSVRVYDFKLARETAALNFNVEVAGLAFSPNGDALVTAGGRPAVVKLWNPRTGDLVATHKVGGKILDVAMAPDGRTLAAAGGGWGKGGLRFLESRGGQVLAAAGTEGAMNCVTFSPDGRMAAAGAADGRILILDGATRSVLLSLPGGSEVNALEFSPDSRTLAEARKDGGVRLRRLPDLSAVTDLGSHSKAATALAISPDGAWLASGGQDKVVRLYRLGAPTAPPPQARVKTPAVMPNVPPEPTLPGQPRPAALDESPELNILESATAIKAAPPPPAPAPQELAAVPQPQPPAPQPTPAAPLPAPPEPAPAVPPAEPLEDQLPARPASQDEEAFAVVIGVERHAHSGVPTALHAGRDARSIHAQLLALGFPAPNITVLRDGLAKRATIERSLKSWLKNRVTGRSRVLVYFAGNGSLSREDGRWLLVPFDVDPKQIERTSLPVGRLVEGLGRLPTKHLVIALDAGFSRSGPRTLANGASPSRGPVSPKAPRSGMLLTASLGTPIATKVAARHGLLTHFLLEGLRGSADTDRDGRTTTAELAGYVLSGVEREARLMKVSQRPGILPALSSLPEGGATVWLQSP